MVGIPGEGVIKSFVQVAGPNILNEHTLTIAGAGGSVAMIMFAVLSIPDGKLTQSALFLCVGVLCLHGEWTAQTDSMSPFHSTMQENFGFTLTPLGRGVAYAVTALHCFAGEASGHAGAFRVGWHFFVIVSLVASMMSLISWRGYHQQVPQQGLLNIEGNSCVEGCANVNGGSGYQPTQLEC
eukprot:TRINITY_DN9304_c0_g2_i1.p1 TRINITY_DN9304_c0_g2~~TRINITY_DN9304_c0_g2_i1.p1  ORF type:complete len:203 (-),score=20.51 TRINITY_DN9304_c0_g2_i1:335-880(-)